ncbi:MAG: hypothetical protein OHK0039_12210 [Bacteroidia bacterium]
MWGGGYALTGTTTWLQGRVSPLSAGERALLNRQDLPAFDRVATYNWSLPVKQASDYVLIGSVLAPPALLLIHSDLRRDGKTLFPIWNEALVLTAGLTGLVKWLTLRPRPYNYLDPGGNYPGLAEELLSSDARLAFFSGHTSLTAVSAFVTARIIHDYFPDSPWRWVGWGTAIVLPAVAGWMRVRAGKHYPSDVIVGYLVGAAVGYTVPLLHKRQ